MKQTILLELSVGSMKLVATQREVMAPPRRSVQKFNMPHLSERPISIESSTDEAEKQFETVYTLTWMEQKSATAVELTLTVDELEDVTSVLSNLVQSVHVRRGRRLY